MTYDLNYSRRVSIAPMMDWTDRHDRYFLRLISKDVLLYTEMINVQAILKGDRDYLLSHHNDEHPIALQLGGSVPADLRDAARIGEQYGYDEINLNVGCPSPRVSKGRFGACLMLEPELVAECISAMINAVSIPITLKCRIGVDHQDSYENLHRFITLQKQADCNIFIIHARKAWLHGLSPKQNREIPPLQYEVVRQLKNDFNDLTIIINGGIRTITDIKEHLKYVDGVMIGREAYQNPYFLADIQRVFFDTDSGLSREQIANLLVPYIDDELSRGTRLASMTRHILNLFRGRSGASIWRRYLSEHMHKINDVSVVKEALTLAAYSRGNPRC